MARPSKKDWVRYQGRANAALVLTARAMNADFVEPVDEKSFGGLEGRTRGCAFELRIATPPGAKEPVLLLTVRHYHTQRQAQLDAEGVRVPNIDPAILQATIESACDDFSTQH